MKFNANIPYSLLGDMGKFLFVMKLIIVLMTSAFLQFSFASEAQKITISERNAPLEKIFKKIRIQTGYDFFCEIELLKNSKRVNIHLKDASLHEVLNSCLENQDLVYNINNKIIVITKKRTPITDKIQNSFKDIYVTGKVLDERGQPLSGATVTVKRTGKSVVTSTKGAYSLTAEETDILIVSYIGYDNKEVKVSDSRPDTSFIISLSLSTNKLQQVEIVSTGYQDLPKERATGSFEVISKEQLQHSTDPNLLKRLEGITTSMDFNNPLVSTLNVAKRRQSPINTLTIRGKNTLLPGLIQDPYSLSGKVLIVIDGIATPYSIDKINPNDVESITILKDAAAASIWGSRASNGVIVIKSKKGRFNSPTTVSFNSNVSITEKIDLFYKKKMSVSEFIDAQVSNYEKNYIDNGSIPVDDPNLVQPQPVMSPVFEIMNDLKIGRINQDQANEKLNVLRGNDIRRDYEKYLLRKPITQNYSLSIDGGSKDFAYRISGGYDHTLDNGVTDGNNRYALNYTAILKPLKNLQVQAIVGYSQQNSHTQGSENPVQGQLTSGGFYPYSRLVDDLGAPTTLYPDFRPAFLDTLAKNYGNKILSMSYKPLEDMYMSSLKIKSNGLNLNLNTSYKISEAFTANLTYNYSWGLSEKKILNDENSYYMRQLINKFTTPAEPAYGNPADPLNGFTPFKKQIPIGGRYIYEPTKSNNQTLRGQLNFNKTWDTKHELSAIAGIDLSQDYSSIVSSQFYGYNKNNLQSNTTLPFGIYVYTLYNDIDFGFSEDQIPFFSQTLVDFKTRMYSLYSNAAYTFDKRYTLSGSIRKDASSLLGNTFNSTGTPYFSVGGSWSINNEKFYKLSWLPYLQLKTTFGYNGNINSRVGPIPPISYSQISTANSLPYANTRYGTNLNLRPEKSGIINLGLNFGLKNNRLSGSIEYYTRKTTDLITTGPTDPSTGFSTQDYNVANLRSTGTDISLNSLNIQSEKFSWTTNLLFSNNRVKVTKLFSNTPPTAGQLATLQVSYNEGADLSRLYAYRWAGLDPKTGDPMGYVNGEAVTITGSSAALTAIRQAPPSSLRLFGSSVPVYYGSFRNTFNYENFSLSANFLYKLGYYFRPPTTEFALYYLLFPGNQLLGGEYTDRWKNPGDENRTHVPSISYSGSSARDLFYYFSEVNVLKGDHIRLQEINLSYTFKRVNRFIKNPRIYAYVNNIGLIWKANKAGIDPDVNDYPQPRTYNMGFSASF